MSLVQSMICRIFNLHNFEIIKLNKFFRNFNVHGEIYNMTLKGLKDYKLTTKMNQKFIDKMDFLITWPLLEFKLYLDVHGSYTSNYNSQKENLLDIKGSYL